MTGVRCPEVNPQGQQCALVAGHSGVHQIAAPGWGPPVAPARPTTGGAVKQGFGWATGCLIFVVFVVVALAVIGAFANNSTPRGGGGSNPAMVGPVRR